MFILQFDGADQYKYLTTAFIAAVIAELEKSSFNSLLEGAVVLSAWWRSLKPYVCWRLSPAVVVGAVVTKHRKKCVASNHHHHHHHPAPSANEGGFVFHAQR